MLSKRQIKILEYVASASSAPSTEQIVAHCDDLNRKTGPRHIRDLCDLGYLHEEHEFFSVTKTGQDALIDIIPKSCRAATA